MKQSMKVISAALLLSAATTPILSQTTTGNATAVQQTASKPTWPTWMQAIETSVETLRTMPDTEADNLVQQGNSAETLARLLELAQRCEGTRRDAVLARYLQLAEQASVNPTERYLLLRSANELATSANLRRKLIIDLGTTHTMQALAAVRPYYDTQDYADAVALATVEIVKHNSEAQGGHHIYNMVDAARMAFIRHYGEEGSDEGIDVILAALDKGVGKGYDLSPSHTSMGKRGFWNLAGEHADMAMMFDWKATGSLVVTLHSVPVLTLDRNRGLRLAGSNEWVGYKSRGQWDTANIRLVGDRISVSINGSTLVSDARLTGAALGQPLNARGHVAFTADDNGAVVEQVCINDL